MSTVVLDFPTFGFVVATRAMIGAGIGLLLANRLSDDKRRTIGLSLLGIGAASTIPAAFALRRGWKEGERFHAAAHVDPVL
jgi:hypothetical protein